MLYQEKSGNPALGSKGHLSSSGEGRRAFDLVLEGVADCEGVADFEGVADCEGVAASRLKTTSGSCPLLFSRKIRNLDP
jgi:hypothetical protein